MILPTGQQDASGAWRTNSMMERLSRRSFAKLLGVGAVGTLIRPSSAQEEQSPQTMAKFDERTTQLYNAAVRSNEGASRRRLGYKLPENSEPCFIFKAEEPR